jgi:hypothetical protein
MPPKKETTITKESDSQSDKEKISNESSHVYRNYHYK